MHLESAAICQVCAVARTAQVESKRAALHPRVDNMSDYPHERRKPNRILDPSCPTCEASPKEVKATQRTQREVHFQCRRCGHLWSIPKPAPYADPREPDSRD